MIRKKNKINISELSWPGCQNSYAVKRRANNNKRNHVYIFSPSQWDSKPHSGALFCQKFKKVFWGGSKLGFFVVFVSKRAKCICPRLALWNSSHRRLSRLVDPGFKPQANSVIVYIDIEIYGYIYIYIYTYVYIMNCKVYIHVYIIPSRRDKLV